MKICDVTQFYSPLGGGVKRYLHDKIAYIQAHRPDDEHVLVVPGARAARTTQGRSRIYTIASPLVSRTTQYRALLDLRAVDEIIEREQPDLIESADPYQLGWATASISRALRIPAVAFYHSDFGEQYLRPAASKLGGRIARTAMSAAEAYTRSLYNRFAVTLTPSDQLARSLQNRGVRNVQTVELGVNTAVFKPTPDDARITRHALNIPVQRLLLLYVGRLAPEKNTRTLLDAFELLIAQQPGKFHLLVIGDGQQRGQLEGMQRSTGAITWLQYCTDAAELARFYRAADIFVHPGTQETFGLVALESQACATPVLGVRGSAMDRIILHDQECWARENTAAALAAAIQDYSARDLCSLGNTAAAAVAERYAWPRVFERLFCVYQEVCADYRRGAAG